MAKLKPKFIKIISKIYSFVVGLLSKILPLKNYIIFESHSDFCDNSKAVFNKIMSYGLNKYYKIYWFVDNKDAFNSLEFTNVEFVQIKHNSFSKKIIGEIKRVILFASCKYYFFSHRNLARNMPKRGQVFFNLTHGTPLKDSTGRHNSIKKSSYILTTSEFSGDLRVRTFEGGEEKLKILGFPRNDFLFEHNKVLEKLGYSKQQFNKVIIWMPTFRRHKISGVNDSGALDEEKDIPILSDDTELNELKSILSNNKVLLIIKPHPAQDLRFIKVEESYNIRIVTNDELFNNNIELYNLLGESDALITDYSSVYMDYLILGKPIGFTIDDLPKYTKNLGFLVKNPLDYMPGHKIRECSDMIKFIEDVCRDLDTYSEERETICNLFNKYKDNKSSDRVLQFLGLIQ
ncbi:MAG: CDP-glycerol glycerophosphotransferase family protein [Tissierellaceae bacterium]|jgi:CDP-glycerol glycerophosphotransferase